MTDLKTKFMGVELKNPIIIGASNLVTDPDIVKKLEDAGAAAIVYKSLFEEQIQLENYEMEEMMQEYNELHAEMTRLHPTLEHAGPQEYLLNLENIVKSVDIPVFASLNAVYSETWADWAKHIEKTGVKGLELNLYSIPRDFNVTSETIEKEQIEIVKSVKEAVKIPFAVKLSPFYTSPLHLIAEMDKAGAHAFVIFNRLFQPDIDIQKQEHHFPFNLSHENDNRLALRFAGLLYGNIKADISANMGIFNGHDVIKMILAGADSTQVVSTIYKNKPAHVAEMLNEINNWMEKNNYTRIDDFRGKLSKKSLKDPFTYKRAQYVDILLRSDQIFAKTALR